MTIFLRASFQGIYKLVGTKTFVIVRQYILYVCCLFIGITASSGQVCSIADTVAIKDLDTTYVSLIIEHAGNDDLSSSSQAVEAVFLNFRHLKLTDIRVNLVSPAGQRVNLMNPVLSNGPITQNKIWDVTFLSSNFPVDPDKDFSNRWKNDNNWSGVNYYNGSYYPSVGHINNLNTGTVSGEWRIEIIDQVQASNSYNPVTGQPFSFFSYFGISFRDNTDIECGVCEPPSSELSNTEGYVICGDEEVELDFDWDDSNNFYDIGWILHSATETYFETGSTLAVSDKDPGQYTLCPVVYYTSQEEKLLDITYDDLVDDIEDGLICARLSSDCIPVEILSEPEVVTIERSICEGEEVSFNGVSYTESGVYDITTPLGNYCDSLSRLNLMVSEIDVALTATVSALSCIIPTSEITPQGLTDDMTWSWSAGQGGHIESEELDGSILITAAGSYTLEVMLNECSKTVDINIGAEPNLNTLSIIPEDILCSGEPARLSIDFDGTISGIPQWTSLESNTFTISGNDILTTFPGTYTVEVQNTSGCIYRDTVTIIRNIANISLKQGIQQQLSCARESIDLEVEGMREGDEYSFTWRKGGSTVFQGNPFTVNAAGDYTVLVKNEDTGCEATRAISITDIRPLFDVLIISTDITCKDDVADLNYFPVNTPTIISERWLNGDGEVISENGSASVMTPGIYILELISDMGCTYRDTATVADKSFPELLEFPDVVKNCRDNPNLLENPLPDYDFTWIEPDSTVRTEENPTAKFIGDYTFYATSNITGCISTGVVTVVNGDNGLPNGIQLVAEDFTCNNAKPQIEVQLGGQALSNDNYNYLWCCTGLNDGFTTNTVTTLGPGYYSVRINIPSEPSCNNWYATKIKADTSSSIELSADTLSCVSDTASIRIPEEYQFTNINWIGPLPLAERTKREPTVSVSANYFVTYTLESNGCQGQDTIFVEEARSRPQLRLDSLSKEAIECNDELDIAVLSRLEESLLEYVSWSGPGDIVMINDTTATVNQAGEYLVVAAGVGYCVDSLYITVPGDTLGPAIELVKSNDIFCNQPEARIDIENAEDISEVNWMADPNIVDQTDQFIHVNAPGSYTVSVTGNNNCVTERTIEIEDLREDPDFELLPDTVITCGKPTIDIGIESDDPDLNIGWLGPSGPLTSQDYAINVDSAATYTIQIWNDQACSRTVEINVTEDLEKPVYEITKDGTLNCEVDQVNVSVENPQDEWTYEWRNNNATASTSTYIVPGSYWVDVTNQRNECNTTVPFTIDIDTTKLVLDTIYGDSLACNALAYLHFTTDNDAAIRNYQWTGPNNYISSESNPILIAGGAYQLTVTAENGCQTMGEVTVSDERLFPVLEVFDGHLRCDGNPTSFFIDTISPNSNIIWSGENIDYFNTGFDATTNMQGTYVGIAENAAGCSVSDTFMIDNEPAYPEFEISTDTFYCDGGRLHAMNVDDDEDFIWKGPNGFRAFAASPEVNELGTYTLVVTSIYGCQDSTSVDLIDGRVYPEINIIQEEPYQCNTEQVDLIGDVSNIAPDRLTYEWEEITGDIISDRDKRRVTIGSLGSYRVTITDDISGCSEVTTYEVVREEQSFQHSTYNLIPPTCDSYTNGVISIEDLDGDYPPYTTYVNGFNYGNQREINYLEPGTYYLRIVDAIGCEIRDTVVIEEPEVVRVLLPADTTVRYGETLTVEGLTNFSAEQIDSILWYGIEDSNSALTQEVTFLENKEITLRVIDENGCMGEATFSVSVIEPNDFWPNVFTPNGDGENDYFYLPFHPAFERVEDLRIYDNWGGLLYENKAVELGIETEGWDGTYEGKTVEQGVYVLTFTGILKGGKTKTFAATVTVLK